MKTFIQFLDEAAHSAGSMVNDWGLIHPKTGALISGQKHPYATTHNNLRKTMKTTHPDISPHHYAEYVHYDAHGNGGTLQVRSHIHAQHQALQKGLKNLPLAKHYEHGRNDSDDKEHFHEFDNAKQLHKHISDLAK